LLGCCCCSLSISFALVLILAFSRTRDKTGENLESAYPPSSEDDGRHPSLENGQRTPWGCGWRLATCRIAPCTAETECGSGGVGTRCSKRVVVAPKASQSEASQLTPSFFLFFFFFDFFKGLVISGTVKRCRERGSATAKDVHLGGRDRHTETRWGGGIGGERSWLGGQRCVEGWVKRRVDTNGAAGA
jgi:hypothetical protein